MFVGDFTMSKAPIMCEVCQEVKATEILDRQNLCERCGDARHAWRSGYLQGVKDCREELATLLEEDNDK